VAAPLFKKIGDGIMRYRSTGADPEQEADLKLALRDWPTSENDEAVVHVQLGKVPELRGLMLKSAVHRVVLAGGVPKVEGLGERVSTAYQVADQSPEPGEPMEAGTVVKLRLQEP
jgi:cell division protein FtsI (penicillin-binding protein 3)